MLSDAIREAHAQYAEYSDTGVQIDRRAMEFFLITMRVWSIEAQCMEERIRYLEDMLRGVPASDVTGENVVIFPDHSKPFSPDGGSAA